MPSSRFYFKGMNVTAVMIQTGRVLLEIDGFKQWILIGNPDLQIVDCAHTGRPRVFSTNAERQKAYRKRQSALRNSSKD